MKRLGLLVAGCAVAMFLGAVPAMADNGPHKIGQGVIADSCAGCHRVHAGNSDMLLVEDQKDLCFTCHGAGSGGAANDVENGVGFTDQARGSSPKALRGGGFDYALIDASNPAWGPTFAFSSPTQSTRGTIPVLTSGATVTSSHSVDESLQMAWGNVKGVTPVVANAVTWNVDGPTYNASGKSTRLRCGSCHDPHGNGNYRILKPIPVDSGYPPNPRSGVGWNAGSTWPVTINTYGPAPTYTLTTSVIGSSTPGVSIPDAPDDASKVYTTNDYWLAGDANAPNYIANVSAWCGMCHSRYLGKRQTSPPVGNAVYRHTSNNGKQDSPNCIQCHVSHGSNSTASGKSIIGEPTDNVGYPYAASPGLVPHDGNRLLRADNRGVCQLCHKK